MRQRPDQFRSGALHVADFSLPHGAYRCLYVDPNWKFKPWSHRGEGKGASRHYCTAHIDEICRLPVGDIAAADAVLFLWVVQAMIPEALCALNAWGFEFKTVAFVWVKMPPTWDPRQLSLAPRIEPRLGLGYHTRSGTEQCWLAIRGKGYKRCAQDVPQVLHAPIREHSRKPDEFVTRIERLVGDVPRAELFARTIRPGWDASGHELRRFNVTEAVRSAPHPLDIPPFLRRAL